MTDQNLRKWLRENWRHTMIVYGAIVITLSLIVQIVATVIH